MDSKISNFTVADSVGATDIIAGVRLGPVNSNIGIPVGVLSLNLPGVGNTGITKNTVAAVAAVAIPLTKTVSVLATGVAYTLAVGSDGQSVVLVSQGTCTVAPVASTVAQIQMVHGSTVTLMYSVAMAKWVIVSSHNCTFV